MGNDWRIVGFMKNMIISAKASEEKKELVQVYDTI